MSSFCTASPTWRTVFLRNEQRHDANASTVSALHSVEASLIATAERGVGQVVRETEQGGGGGSCRVMRRRVKAAPEWILLSGSKPKGKNRRTRTKEVERRWTAATDALLGAPHELSEQQRAAETGSW